ncbi:MAG: ABC transporter permease [Chthoniobacterales bacterium]
MAESTAAVKKETIITSKKKWFDFQWKELWNARELIFRFVHRDFVSGYKQTILGPFWFIVPPLMTTVVYTFIFGQVAKIPTDGAPQFLFFMPGVILWGYFSSCLLRTSNTFAGSAGLFGKVYFPRLTVPLSILTSNLLTLGIQIVIFFVVFLCYYLKGAVALPNLWILTLPLLVLTLAILGLGVGSFVSSLTTYYRDFAMIVSFGVQLWMYGSCVMYPFSQVPESLRWIIALNPVAPIIEWWRYACFGKTSMNPAYLGLSVITTLIICCIGMVIFRRMENTFMDTV